MKTKLFLLAAVLAVAAAQGAAPAPKWAGDRPGSFMRRQTDPQMAAWKLSETDKAAQQGKLSPEQLAEHEANRAEYNAYFDYVRSQKQY
jgi:cell division protein FtsW (lipid II flippase)